MEKRAAVINDLSSFGGCSLTAFIAVLAALGVQPCPLPTAVLSAQSEFERFYRRDLTDDLPRWLDAWQANGERFDGICTGYFSAAGQLDSALRLIRGFRADGGVVIVDPVMGDDGALYPGFDRDVCRGMRRLAAQADVLLPNVTELCLLSGADYAALAQADNPLPQIEALAKPLAAGRGVVVTGIHCHHQIGNLVISGGEARLIACEKLGGRFSGTGDLFSAVVSGCVLNGKTLFQAAQTAADFVHAAIAETVRAPYDPLYGVRFENVLHLLTEVTTHANNKSTDKKQN